MIQKVMRIDLAVNLAAFLALFFRLGSPIQHFSALAFVNFVSVLWILSTAALLILFTLRIVKWAGNKDSRGIWFDLILMAIWIVAMGVMAILGGTEFAGF
jgi:hypothetical protein